MVRARRRAGRAGRPGPAAPRRETREVRRGRQVRYLPADGVRAAAGRGPRGVAGGAPGGVAARVARAARPGDAARRQHDVQPQAAPTPAPRRLARRPADDDPPAHGRQDEPSADVRRVPPRHRHRAGARTRAARVHTRGGPRQDLPSDGGVPARQLRSRGARGAGQLVHMAPYVCPLLPEHLAFIDI